MGLYEMGLSISKPEIEFSIGLFSGILTLEFIVELFIINLSARVQK